ncbi:RHS domain-containing protein [Xanthomonas graminis]|uniref:RHS domain-containing protein n=1 Tax=Xanthomonas graminis TaxID=3390026 RepID=UPI00396A0898
MGYDRYGLLASLRDALGHESRYAHDALGRLHKQVDPLGQATHYDYDAKGRLLRVRSADGGQVQCAYDAEDQLVRYVDEAGAQTRLHYVGIGQIGKRVQPDGHTVEYRYDSEEQLVAVINQRGEAYRLRRDPLGRIVEETDYWGQSRHYQYDACGRLTATIDPLGQRIAFATDALGRIVRKTLPDIRTPGQQVQEQFAYDARGQLVELRNRHRTATRRFDALGQVLEEVQDGFRVGYGYDAVGNRVLRETSAGNRIAFGYDLRDQVVEVAINDDAPIVIERDALGRATREQLSAQVQRQFQYDGRSLLTAQTVLRDAAPLFETTYDYDRAGNLTHRRDSAQGVDEYRYDVLGRLLQHTDPKARIERFFNDPAGDRLATRIHQVQMRKVVGGDDEQQVQWTREGSYDGVHYVFDRAGDLIRKGSPNGPEPDDLELFWDANHRLAESRKAGQATHYGYDPLGRRVFKRNPTHTTWFYWDGDALLGEVKQAHDEPDAAPVWVGNVANLIEVRKRQEKLKRLHERTREYVYYPGSFVPLALIEKEQCAAPLELAQPATTSISQILRSDAPAVAKHALTDSRGSDSTQPSKPSAPADISPPQRTPSAPLGVLASSTSKPAPADGAAARPATMAAPTAIKTAKPPSSNGLGMLGGDLALGQGAGTKTPAIARALVDPPTGVAKSDEASVEGEQKPSNVVALGMWLGHSNSGETESAPGSFGNSAAVGSAPADGFAAPNKARGTVQSGFSDLVEPAAWQSVSYHYHSDPNGCPTRLTTVSGRLVWSASYAAWGGVAEKTLPDIRTPGQQVQEQFAYDARGQLVELRNRHRTATRRFDALGQVLEEVQDGFRVGYGYDAVGNRVLRETSAGNRIAFGYDLRDQVVEVAINDDAPIVIERDALGRTTREQLSAQVQRQFQYDGRSLLTAQSVLKDAVPLFETTYDYDRAGNLTHRRDSAQGVDEYRYDVLGRLLQHTDPKGRIERFFNDPAGDRLATRIQQVQMRKVVGGDDDQQVQWTREGSYAGVHYVFDRAGDLIRKGSPTGPEPDDLELLWDANHRLAESRKAGQATHYGYDPLGRRVFKRNPTHTTSRCGAR